MPQCKLLSGRGLTWALLIYNGAIPEIWFYIYIYKEMEISAALWASTLYVFYVTLKVKGGVLALYEKPISELRSVTCRMGSHSVTCHPTQVNAPRLNPSQIGWYSIYLPRRDGRLS